jgi:Fe-S oxidoreductase
LKNEYPELGGHYEVLHHTELLQSLLNEGKITISGGTFQGKRITYHDPCYLGRANGVYEPPREILEKLDAALAEMPRNRERGFCCGAGGAQMFKEAEPGEREVNVARSEEALAQNPDVIAVGCPFCKTMMADGVKHFEKEEKVTVMDVAELIAQSADL